MSTDDSTDSNLDGADAKWTEDQLPPIKPPSTGLLMQLFFIPMIIVSIIVSVWLMFGWLAQSATNPEKLASNLKRLNKGSWQDAHSLSNLLRDPREVELRQNHELAKSLAETLDSLLNDKAFETSEEQHRLVTWLCRALGEFEVDDGLDTMVNALQVKDFAVRRSAVEGISTLAGKLKGNIAESREDMVQVLTEPAMERSDGSDRDQEIEFGEMRSAVAYALGLIGGDEATTTLTLMLSDPYPEARYNAATGLARNGDLRAVPRLREMLQVENDEATRYEEPSKTLRQWKRNLVIVNGLRAVIELDRQIEGPLDDGLVQAVKELENAKVLQSRDKLVLDAVVRLIAERNN